MMQLGTKSAYGPRGNLIERFWSKVDKGENCWNWLAGTNQYGYGTFNINGTPRLAHRIAYELTQGMIPPTMQLDHLCRNHKCVNPLHLEIVTRRENILRGEGLAAQQARQTHCKNGHPLVEGNLVPANLRHGHRTCRICDRARKRHAWIKAYANPFWISTRTRWTKTQYAFLVDNYRIITVNEIARALKKSPEAVRKKIRRTIKQE